MLLKAKVATRVSAIDAQFFQGVGQAADALRHLGIGRSARGAGPDLVTISLLGNRRRARSSSGVEGQRVIHHQAFHVLLLERFFGSMGSDAGSEEQGYLTLISHICQYKLDGIGLRLEEMGLCHSVKNTRQSTPGSQ